MYQLHNRITECDRTLVPVSDSVFGDEKNKVWYVDFYNPYFIEQKLKTGDVTDVQFSLVKAYTIKPDFRSTRTDSDRPKINFSHLYPG